MDVIQFSQLCGPEYVLHEKTDNEIKNNELNDDETINKKAMKKWVNKVGNSILKSSTVLIGDVPIRKTFTDIVDLLDDIAKTDSLSNFSYQLLWYELSHNKKEYEQTKERLLERFKDNEKIIKIISGQ